MLTFHVIPLFLVIASEVWNLKVCACAMILDSSLRSATFRMTECQHYLVLILLLSRSLVHWLETRINRYSPYWPTIATTIFCSDRLAADAGPGRRRSQLPQIRPAALEAPDFVGIGEKPARQDGQRGRRSGGGRSLGTLPAGTTEAQVDD